MNWLPEGDQAQGDQPEWGHDGVYDQYEMREDAHETKTWVWGKSNKREEFGTFCPMKKAMWFQPQVKVAKHMQFFMCRKTNGKGTTVWEILTRKAGGC